MHVIEILTHSPESCPLGNPKKLEIMMNWLEKIDALAAKHGIKVVGVWTDRWDIPLGLHMKPRPWRLFRSLSLNLNSWRELHSTT